jgi:hypothetical protein
LIARLIDAFEMPSAPASEISTLVASATSFLLSPYMSPSWECQRIAATVAAAMTVESVAVQTR